MGYNIIMLLFLPPFFVGVINRVKSIFAGRKGPPVFQLYFDLYKLLKKGAVYSKSTSFIFRVAPLVVLASVACAGIFLPMSGTGTLNFYGDIILFVYLFALARFFIIIAALDTGSSFEGMGGSREAVFGAFSELTVFIVIATLAVVSHSFSLGDIFTVNQGHFIAEPSMILLFLAFFFVLLTENSRMPVDDPNTHLELTMIHEVMILDYSGPDLAIMLYASSMKLFVYMAFAVMFIYPNAECGPLVGSLILLLKVMGVAILIGIVESVTARIRLLKVPQFLIASFVLSVFALLTALFVRGNI